MSLLAITSYYNPLKGYLRRTNYQCFKKHLGVPLLTVEWSQHGHFELGKQDADELIQLSGGDLLWQKERLLNIGLVRAIELGFDKVAFLDSDIVFEDPKWHEEVSEGLNHSEFMQCFRTVNYLPESNNHELSRGALFKLPFEYQMQSLTSMLIEGKNLYCIEGHDFRGDPIFKVRGNPGMAIAVHVGKLRGWSLYEGNIVGGGDFVIQAAINGSLAEMYAVRPFSPGHMRHLNEWADLHCKFNIRTRASSGRVCHLWHGRLADRQYEQRYSILPNCDYNPAIDIDMNSSGPLRFAPDSLKLSQAVEAYIASRKDG